MGNAALDAWIKANVDVGSSEGGDLCEIVGRIVAAERERCARIADERAAACQRAYDAGDTVEVHPLNEALHIAQLIRNSKP